MCGTHTGDGIVKIQAWLVKTAVLELVHHHVVCLLRVKVVGVVGVERRDAVHKTLLYEVLAEVHVIVSTNGESHIERTCPVVVGQHLEQHQVTLVEGALTASEITIRSESAHCPSCREVSSYRS